MYKNVIAAKWIPRNPKKWVNPDNIIARSNIERRVFYHLDMQPNIKLVMSEELAIPYISPLDGKPHRYFVDLIVKTAHDKVFLVEIKPDSQCRPPKRPKKQTTNYIQAIATWSVNCAKWEAAAKFAEERGMEFMIFTEKHLENRR